MKVISFSIWGTDKHFADGALANVELARSLYPDWFCWFYCRTDVPADTVRELRSKGAIVLVRKQSLGDWEGLFWRFEPIFDPLITHTISRDCDSRVNPREAAAVNSWMNSGRLFHTMRDHYEHNVPVLGGMFGCLHWPRMKNLLDDWKDFNAKGTDQHFLQNAVWPLVSVQAVAHDRYPEGMTMPERDGTGVYRYNPMEFFGRHDIRPFPPHPPLNPKIHGEHVGARVGIP